jgi:DNA-binding LacI/PurR family transcriptional regulator
MGYRPDASARLLRQRRSYQIGVLYAMHQPFEVDLVEHLFTAARERGYAVVLGPLSPSRPQAMVVEELLQQRIEALIVLATDGGRATCDPLKSRDLPVVELSGPRTTPPGDEIRVDNAEGMELAIEHLTGLGHTRIAHIDGGMGPNADERRDAYLAAMARRGLTEQAEIVPSAYDEDAGSAAASALLERAELPTAITCANDRCAFGVIETLVRAGIRIPDDVSIVGYDDSSIASLRFLQMTTVRHDPAILSALAVEAVVDRLSGTNVAPWARRVRAQLVIRSTTGAPRVLS